MSNKKPNKNSRGVLASLVGAAYKTITVRTAQGLTSLLLGTVAIAMVMIPATKWYLSMENNANDLNDNLLMQTIIQDKWNTLNAET